MTGLAVGVGVADITPQQPVRLAGFLARQPPVPPLVVNDPLQARALAIRSGDDVAVLVVCDLVGMSGGVSASVRVAVNEATGVPVERVLTACTHTHSGPDTLLGMDLYDGYLEDLTGGVVSAVEQAITTTAPASFGIATVPVPTQLAVNRRGRPFDPRLVLLDIWAGERRLASVTNVGIHPVTHGPDVHVVTADWVGHFRIAMEAALGGASVLLSGPLGDVNPPGGDGYERAGGGVELAMEVGESVAEVAATAALRTQATDGGLRLHHRTAELEVADGPVPSLIAGGARRVVAELYEWQLAGVRVVSLPGEPLSAFADAVTSTRGEPVLVAGLAPSWQGYLPHPDEFDPAGYEESTSLGRAAVAALLEAVTIAP